MVSAGQAPRNESPNKSDVSEFYKYIDPTPTPGFEFLPTAFTSKKGDSVLFVAHDRWTTP